MPPPPHVPGLFSTSLVKQQTSVDAGLVPATGTQGDRSGLKDFERRNRGREWQWPPITAVENVFRHSGWTLERERVKRAMLATVPRPSRFERFDNCGSDCVVEYSPSAARHRVRANYCGDRFCVPCCRARAVKFQAEVRALLGDRVPLFITLTLRNSSEPLASLLNHLQASFRRLRQTRLWRDAVLGGVGVIEVKKGKGGFGWHPHLHVVAVGGYMHQGELSDAWRKCTGGSFIVDIQRARKTDDACLYAAKYVSKGWTSEVARDHDALVECIVAMRGRRLLITFGEWHGLDVERPDDDPGDWRNVGSLDYIFAADRRGEQWAVGILRALGVRPPERSRHVGTDPDG